MPPCPQPLKFRPFPKTPDRKESDMSKAKDPEKVKEGWLWLENAKLRHYIKDGRSLCGKCGYWLSFYAIDVPNDSKNNCKSCAKKAPVPTTE